MAEAGLYIDGKPYTTDDLTYREQREMRAKIKEEVPNADLDDAAEIDFIPAFIWAIKKRTDPDFTFDQALDMKPGDLQPPKTRPTKQTKG